MRKISTCGYSVNIPKSGLLPENTWRTISGMNLLLNPWSQGYTNPQCFFTGYKSTDGGTNQSVVTWGFGNPTELF